MIILFFIMCMVLSPGYVFAADNAEVEKPSVFRIFAAFGEEGLEHTFDLDYTVILHDIEQAGCCVHYPHMVSSSPSAVRFSYGPATQYLPAADFGVSKGPALSSIGSLMVGCEYIYKGELEEPLQKAMSKHNKLVLVNVQEDFHRQYKAKYNDVVCVLYDKNLEEAEEYLRFVKGPGYVVLKDADYAQTIKYIVDNHPTTEGEKSEKFRFFPSRTKQWPENLC